MKKSFGSGIFPPALAALLAATALLTGSCAPSAPRAASMEVSARRQAWAFGPIGGEELATAHYRIYTTSRNRHLLAYLPGFMEAAHGNYLDLTGLGEPPATREPMSMYVLATREQWAVMTRRVTAPRSEIYLAIRHGGYCHGGVCVLWDMGHFATFSIAAHEGLHQFCHHRLRDRVPAWAEEGLAVLAEGFQVDGGTVRFDPRDNTLRRAALRKMLADGRWIPLAKLLSDDAGDHVGTPRVGHEYYCQLWAMMLLIRSEARPRAGLARLLRDAAAGRLRAAIPPPPGRIGGKAYNRAVAVAVFRKYVDQDLSAFETRCRAFARKLARLD